jgi:hypothetical protein
METSGKRQGLRALLGAGTVRRKTPDQSGKDGSGIIDSAGPYEQLGFDPLGGRRGWGSREPASGDFQFFCLIGKQRQFLRGFGIAHLGGFDRFQPEPNGTFTGMPVAAGWRDEALAGKPV